MSEAPRLYQRNVDLAGKVAAAFHLPGADRDDVLQEARFALWDACRCYQPGHGTTFRTFAAMVIRRHLVTQVIAANRGQHLVLTQSARVGRNEDGDTVAILDLLADPDADPAVIAVTRDELRRLITVVCNDMTPLERQAVIGIAVGLSYAEIEGVADVASLKQIDNAVQRARRKLREAA